MSEIANLNDQNDQTKEVAIVPSDTLASIVSSFIRVPPQLFIQFGSQGKRAWFLDLERHIGDVGVVLFTLPGCPLCSYIAQMLPAAQRIAREQMNKTVMLYIMEVAPNVIKSNIVTRGLNIVKYPTLMMCKTTTGRLLPFLEDEDILKNLTPLTLAETIVDKMT